MTQRISRMCQEISPSATLQLNARVNELRAQGQDIISLGAGEPDFDTPLHIRKAAMDAISLGCTRYTAASGTVELRTAVADHLLKEKGLSYAPDEIVISTGAKQALMNALAAILNPGDEVLLPAPCWVSYPEMIAMAGGKAVWVHADEQEGFVPSIQKLRAAVTERTKALIINSPSNPTGAIWTREQLLQAGELALEKGLILISDEIYDQLTYDGLTALSPASLSREIANQAVVINGWSKSYAMTGWRLGYAAAPRDIAKAMSAYQSHFTGNPNAIAQAAGLCALKGDQSCVTQMAAAFGKRRDLMAALLQKMPLVSCFVPKGAFYIMLNIRNLIGRRYQGKEITGASSLSLLLLEYAQIAVVAGEPFGAPDYCRLSFAISEERLKESMARLEAFLYALDS